LRVAPGKTPHPAHAGLSRVIRHPLPQGERAKLFVTASLTLVPVSITYTSESRPTRTRLGRQTPVARASAEPAGGLATRSRAALGINPPAHRAADLKFLQSSRNLSEELQIQSRPITLLRASVPFDSEVRRAESAATLCELRNRDTSDRSARCVAGLGQAGAGNARSKGCAKRVPAASQEAWPGAESLEMKNY